MESEFDKGYQQALKELADKHKTGGDKELVRWLYANLKWTS